MNKMYSVLVVETTLTEDLILKQIHYPIKSISSFEAERLLREDERRKREVQS